jgi:mRNA interferase MazF
MKRGDVYTARLDPVEGSEQAGTRPIVIVSRDAINDHATFVLGAALTTYRGRRLSPSHVLIDPGDGGLTRQSVVLGEQVRVLSKTRLGRRWGGLSPAAMERLDRAIRIVFDLA